METEPSRSPDTSSSTNPPCAPNYACPSSLVQLSRISCRFGRDTRLPGSRTPWRHSALGQTSRSRNWFHKQVARAQPSRRDRLRADVGGPSTISLAP
jgi:hypothetical protein